VTSILGPYHLWHNGSMNEKQTPAVDMVTSQGTVRPTKKQKELLGFIESFIAEHGYSPSYREIMNGLEYTSVATVALHIGNLIKRGHLRKRDHSARSLEVVTPSDSTQPEVLKTNVVKEAEEKWLVGKVEQFFAGAEAEALPTQEQLDNLYVLLGALRVLGLSGAAQSFMERLATLKSRAVGNPVSI
jgi:SOS-response transcriptional repressor LexA